MSKNEKTPPFPQKENGSLNDNKNANSPTNEFVEAAKPRQNILTIFVDSAKELKTTRCLAATGMLTALNLVLGLFSIPVGSLIKFSLSFLATAVAGAMFGPIPAAFCAGIADILKAILKPTGPYFPGFTVSAVLVGVVYGLFFYKGKMTFWRVLGSELITRTLIGILLQAYWMTFLYSDRSLWMIIPDRVLQNAIMLPLGTVLLMLMSVAVKQAEKIMKPAKT